jgi:hypothetical protein
VVAVVYDCTDQSGGCVQGDGRHAVHGHSGAYTFLWKDMKKGQSTRAKLHLQNGSALLLVQVNPPSVPVERFLR